MINKIETVIKTRIKKNTEYTAFLEIVTISAAKTVIVEKKKKNKECASIYLKGASALIFSARTLSHLSPFSNSFCLL